MDGLYNQLPGLIAIAFGVYLKHKDTIRTKELEEARKKQEEADIESKKRHQAIQDGVFALLKHNLGSEYRKIMDRADEETHKPYIYIWELEIIKTMNAEYHNLGGNGTVASLIKELEGLDKKVLK